MSISMSAHEARLKMKEVLTTAEHGGEVVELTRWGKVAATVVRADVGLLVAQLGMGVSAQVLSQYLVAQNNELGTDQRDVVLAPNGKAVLVDLDEMEVSA